jgi:hypothetical protein
MKTSSAAAALLPFVGAKCHSGERRGYGMDSSGTKLYRFNSLGFRCAEFDKEARFRLFVCGCSYTFGTGLNEEETWPHLLARRLTADLGLRDTDLNLQNFSQGGASNDYVSRTIVAQCGRAKPDLAIAYFTHNQRTEFLTAKGAVEIGRWTLRLAAQGRAIDAGYSSQDALPSVDDLLDVATCYLATHDKVNAYLAGLKNLLLAQYFFERHAIPFLMVWRHHADFFSNRHGANPACAQLAEAVSQRHLCATDLLSSRTDYAADGAHPGPQSHWQFAEKLLGLYRRLYAPRARAAGPGHPPAPDRADQ